MFNDKTIEILEKPLELHKIIGNNYSYVKIADVIDKLNEAFNYEWSTKIISIERDDKFVFCHLSVSVKTDSGNIIEKHGVGSAEIITFTRGPKEGKIVNLNQCYTSAFAFALKQAIKQFGVRGGDDEDDEQYSSQSEPNKPSQPQIAVPRNIPQKQAPQAQLNRQPMQQPKQNQSMQQPRQNQPSQINQPRTQTQNYSNSTASKPVMNLLKNNPQDPKSASTIIKNSVVNYPMPDKRDLSDVQLTALNKIRERTGRTSDDLIKNILNSNKKSFEELTKEEAAKIIHLMNDQYIKGTNNE